MTWIYAFSEGFKTLVGTIVDLPARVVKSVGTRTARTRQMEALRLVTTAQFVPGVDRRALCNAILRAKNVELFDWYTYDRFVRVELPGDHGIVLIHTADDAPKYAVTDLTLGWRENFYVPLFTNADGSEETTLVN